MISPTSVSYKPNSAEWWRERRRTNINSLLNVRYLDIKRRSEGRATTKSSAEGKPYLTRKEFWEWYEKTKESFDKIYKAWGEAGYSRLLAPSVDRIDNNLGYTKDNMQWLTNADNRHKGRK